MRPSLIELYKNGAFNPKRILEAMTDTELSYRNKKLAETEYADALKIIQGSKGTELLVGLSTPIAPYIPITSKKRLAKPHVVNKRHVLMEKQQYKCAYCDQQFNSTRVATFDHILPKSRGGKDGLANLVLACYPCNALKGNMASYEEAKRKADIYMAFAEVLKGKGFIQ